MLPGPPLHTRDGPGDEANLEQASSVEQELSLTAQAEDGISCYTQLWYHFHRLWIMYMYSHVQSNPFYSNFEHLYYPNTSIIWTPLLSEHLCVVQCIIYKVI